MKHFKPNVVRGGTAIGLGDNLFLMKGRKHSEGGIDVGENPRTGLEVENNEVMQVTPKGVKVFSAQPILGGISPAQYILGGANPNQVFNAQEAWKKFNGINDDGTRKAQLGKGDNTNYNTMVKPFYVAEKRNNYVEINKNKTDNYKDEPKIDDFSNIKLTKGRTYNIDYINYINKKFIDAGISNKERAIFLGNIMEESGGDPFAKSTNNTYQGLFQWGNDRYVIGDETDPYKEIDNQLNYFFKTIRDTTDRVSWTHGGKGSKYNSLKEAYEAFNSDNLYNSHRAFSFGYVRPEGKEDSSNNRYKVVQQVFDRINYKYGGRKIAKDGIYTVKQGDTLTAIAKQNNIGLPELLRYNRNITNPDLIKVGQNINLSSNEKEYKPENRNLKQYYSQEDEYNKDNISAIQHYNHKGNYAIIDKKAKTIKVYDKGNNLLYESNKINTGKANTDYNTVTYTNSNGKLLYNEGNNSTPAGITVISSKGNYHGLPSFQRSRVDGNGNIKYIKDKNGNIIPDNIASSIHFERGIEGENASNGCVRADANTLKELNKYLQVGDTIYTLPQQSGSQFQLRDGRLNFVDTRDKNQRDEDDLYRNQTKTLSDGRKVSLKYHRDLNTTINGTYLPISIELKDDQNLSNKFYNNGIKSFAKSLAERFIKPTSFESSKRKNINDYAEALANNKQNIMNAIPGLNNKEYNNLLTLALGIPERETHYNTDFVQLLTNSLSERGYKTARKIKSVFDSSVSPDSSRSIGYGKVKYNSDNKELKAIYNKLGVNYNKTLNAEESAKIVMSKLAYTYLNEIKGRTFVDNDGNPLSEEEALYFAYTGVNKQKIGNNKYKFSKNYPRKHYNQIKEYGNQFNIMQNFKYGGIYIKPSKRGTFTAAAKKHGMSVQGFASKVLANKDNYSPSLVKKANFARNASKWHKKEFGGQLNNNNMTFDYLLGSNRQLYRLGGRKKAEDGIFIDGKLYDKKGNVKFDTNINPLIISGENKLNTVNDLIRKKAVEGVGDALLVANGKIRTVNNPIKNIRAVSNIATNNIASNPVKTNKGNDNMPFKVPTFLPATKADKWDLGLNLAGNLLSTITNGIAINSMEYPRHIPLRAIKQNTEYNVEPQIGSTRETVAKNERDITDNTTSSRIALNRRQLARNLGNRILNDIYGQKENIENNLVRENLYNIQNVGNQNIMSLNRWLAGKSDFNNKKQELLSENIVSGITNAVDAVVGERGYLSNIENRRTKQQLLNRDYLSSLLMALSSPNSQFVKDLISDPAFVQYARENGFTLPNIK